MRADTLSAGNGPARGEVKVKVGVSFFGEGYVLTVVTTATEGEPELDIVERASEHFEQVTGAPMAQLADRYSINELPEVEES